MMYKIGDKEFGVHFGMLFQEIYFKEAAKKAAGGFFTTTTFAAFLIYYGNYNYSELNSVQPAFDSLGEVYKLMEANPASDAYETMTIEYNKSQAANVIEEVNKAATETKPAKKKTSQRY